MVNLNIERTQATPAVTANWNTGIVEMRGESYPENSVEWFSPILEWIEAFVRDGNTCFSLKLNLLYLNTSSVKAMMDIFDVLEDAYRNGRQVHVTWYYDERNERIVQVADEFKEDCSFPFQIISYVE